MVKTVNREKFLPLNENTRKKNAKIDNLSFHLSKLEIKSKRIEKIEKNQRKLKQKINKEK